MEIIMHGLLALFTVVALLGLGYLCAKSPLLGMVLALLSIMGGE